MCKFLHSSQGIQLSNYSNLKDFASENGAPIHSNVTVGTIHLKWLPLIILWLSFSQSFKQTCIDMTLYRMEQQVLGLPGGTHQMDISKPFSSGQYCN